MKFSNFFEYFFLRIYYKRYQKNQYLLTKRNLENTLIKESNQKQAILVCLHSFEWGGAERFAYETLAYLKQKNANLLIFVEKKTEIATHFLPLIKDSQIIYAHTYQNAGDQVGDLVASYNITKLYIHHSWSAYKALPLPKQVFVIDSLHIIEYQTGGYPYISAKNSAYIDKHHVVSLGLKTYLVDVLGVLPQKIIVAGLPRQQIYPKQRPNNHKLVVGFLGRFERQKRPEMFVQLVKNFAKNPNIAFIMQGEGKLLDTVTKMARRYKLDNLKIQPASMNVDDFYNSVDVVLNCSENEGLALVGIESVQYNKVFISSNVGQEDEITVHRCLLDAHPSRFLEQAYVLLGQLINDKTLYQSIINEQQQKLKKITDATFGQAVLSVYF